MFMALTLLFLNTGPLNAAMANVLPAHRLEAVGLRDTMAIHLLGGAASPTLIGFASDQVGLNCRSSSRRRCRSWRGLVLL